MFRRTVFMMEIWIEVRQWHDLFCHLLRNVLKAHAVCGRLWIPNFCSENCRITFLFEAIFSWMVDSFNGLRRAHCLQSFFIVSQPPSNHMISVDLDWMRIFNANSLVISTYVIVCQPVRWSEIIATTYWIMQFATPEFSHVFYFAFCGLFALKWRFNYTTTWRENGRRGRMTKFLIHQWQDCLF